MSLTAKQVQEYRDQIFNTQDHYELQGIASAAIHDGLPHSHPLFNDLVERLDVGKSFEELSWHVAPPVDSRDLQGLLLCCAAQYSFLGGEDQHGG